MFFLNHKLKFKKMREVGAIVTKCLDELNSFIKPGTSTDNINQFVYHFQEEHEVKNSQFGYHPAFSETKFPAYCCTSINEVLCHGLPNKNDILQEGDIVSVDITFNKDGFHADACRTYLVGEISKQAQDLCDVAENALHIGIQQCHPGNKISNIGRYIEQYVKHNKLWVVGDFVGHGVGQNFHEYPTIPHVLNEDMEFSAKMEVGQTFSIEPIITNKMTRHKVMRDKWTVIAKDAKLAAQFEATVGITEDGVEVFCK